MVDGRPVIGRHGPRAQRSDHGPEFVSRATLRWIAPAGIDTAFIDPGKPWQNCTDESFNGKFRAQLTPKGWARTFAARPFA